MAGGGGGSRAVWMKQAEDAKAKEEQEKAAAARAAFEATFKNVDKSEADQEEQGADPDSEAEEAKKPIGPVDPAKCTAAGTGVGGGAAGAAASFVVVTKDSEGRRIHRGGSSIAVKVTPAAGAPAGNEQGALVKDHGDGTYTVTYAVAKRGDYMVSVNCNGQPISGSPFPVFFSGGGGGIPMSGISTGMPGFVNSVATPSLPNLVMPGFLSGMMGMIPGILPGATSGVVLPGLGAAFGEVCRDYLNGRCGSNDCRHNHPPHNQLMAALSAGSTMGALSRMPMGPSAAAMAAAQTIVAAQALQAHAALACVQSAGGSTGSKGQGDGITSPEEKDKSDVLLRTLQVSNLSPLLTPEQLQRLFSYCGTVIDFRLADSKQLAYVEYAKTEEAKAALALNNMDVAGRPLNVEMAKWLPPKTVPSVSNVTRSAAQPAPLPMMMQQAVAMQQLQFQQALMMQQAVASQQAASRAATVKSATEAAAVRAAEISKRLKGDSDIKEDKDPSRRMRSRSRSRTPVGYTHIRCHRSRSNSPIQYHRDRRPRSRSRDRHRHRSHSRDRNNRYRESRDSYRRYHAMRERESERDHYSRSSKRGRSRSWSRSRKRRSSRPRSRSPKYRKERKISQELNREDHKSARCSRPSKSISRDSREGSLDVDASTSPTAKKDKVEAVDAARKGPKGIKEDKDNGDLGKSENCGKNLRISEKFKAGEVMEKNSNCEKLTRETVEEKYNEDLNKQKGFRGKARKTEGVMVSEDSMEDRSTRKYSRAGKTHGFHWDGEMHEKSIENINEKGPDDDNREIYKEKKRQSMEIDAEQEVIEKEQQENEMEADDEEVELEENKLHEIDRKLVADEEEDWKKRKPYKKDTEADEKKERKRYKKKHKRGDSIEKRDRKKKKNHHRRSSSYSAESSPLADIDSDDIPWKKGSNRQKQKHRGVSKSISPSCSSQD